MDKSTSLNIPLYECVVKVIVTNDLTKAVNKLYKKHKETEDFKSSCSGLVYTPSMQFVYLVLNNNITHNTIAHEIHHVTQSIAKHRFINEEEAQAWICGYVTEMVYKFLNNNNIKIKHG